MKFGREIVAMPRLYIDVSQQTGHNQGSSESVIPTRARNLSKLGHALTFIVFTTLYDNEKRKELFISGCRHSQIVVFRFLPPF